jgi:hypothetical protein
MTLGEGSVAGAGDADRAQPRGSGWPDGISFTVPALGCFWPLDRQAAVTIRICGSVVGPRRGRPVWEFNPHHAGPAEEDQVFVQLKMSCSA